MNVRTPTCQERSTRLLDSVGLAMCLAIGSVACGADNADASNADASSGAAVMDSGGAVHVTYCGACEAPRAWTLGSTLVTLGTGAGGLRDEFFQIGGAFRLGDGRLVVANRSTRELRYFDNDGTPGDVIGGFGEGPGEFRSMSWVGLLPGDTIAVYDIRTHRLTVFDVDGTVVKTRVVLAEGISIPWISGMLTSEIAVVSEGLVVDASAALGSQRPPVSLAVIDLSTGSMTTIGTFPGRETMVYESSGQKAAIRPFFGLDTFFAVSPRGIVVGNNVEYRIWEYSRAGKLGGSVSREDARRRVESDDLLTLETNLLSSAQSDADRRRINRRLSVMPQVVRMPAFDTLLLGPNGELWVRRYVGPRDTDTHWDVFDRENRWSATLTVPASLTITHIESDAIVAAQRDSLDVELVLVVELSRSK